MSADNGIYIGRFKENDGTVTYRVIHAQAIENCDRSSDFSQELTDSYRVMYYGKSLVFLNEDNALKEAKRLYHEIIDNGWILEYGISHCFYDEPFPTMTYEEANKVQEKEWEK